MERQVQYPNQRYTLTSDLWGISLYGAKRGETGNVKVRACLSQFTPPWPIPSNGPVSLKKVDEYQIPFGCLNTVKAVVDKACEAVALMNTNGLSLDRAIETVNNSSSSPVNSSGNSSQQNGTTTTTQGPGAIDYSIRSNGAKTETATPPVGVVRPTAHYSNGNYGPNHYSNGNRGPNHYSNGPMPDTPCPRPTNVAFTSLAASSNGGPGGAANNTASSIHGILDPVHVAEFFQSIDQTDTAQQPIYEQISPVPKAEGPPAKKRYF